MFLEYSTVFHLYPQSMEDLYNPDTLFPDRYYDYVPEYFYYFFFYVGY